jgi:phage host-nuclease inhibitor protein Gam
MSNTIDMTSMLRGEGEWKNMQEILRRTLKLSFDQMEKQGEQIAHLVGQVASLKGQLASKVNRDEVDHVVKTHTRGMATSAAEFNKLYISRNEYDKIKDQVVHMRNDLERKASIRYVDESLHRKLDRSDVLVKNLQAMSPSQYATQLAQMLQEIAGTKSDVSALARATSDLQRDLGGATELHAMRHQIEAVYLSMQDYYTKNHIMALLDQKVGRECSYAIQFYSILFYSILMCLHIKIIHIYVFGSVDPSLLLPFHCTSAPLQQDVAGLDVVLQRKADVSSLTAVCIYS